MEKITRLFIALGLLMVSCSIAEAGEADSSKSLPTTPLHSFEGGRSQKPIPYVTLTSREI